MVSSVVTKPLRAGSGAKASLLILLVLVAMAFTVHLLPLSFSNYPFNNDGLTESVAAENIVRTGHIQLPSIRSVNGTHSESTPVFNIFLAFSGGLLGQDPMFASQFVVAGFSILTVLGAYLLAQMVTGDRRSAIVAAVFVCGFGTFLFQTASVWKVALGMPLFMLLMYAYANRTQRRMRALEIGVLLLVPLVHHLIAFVCYMTLGYLTIWSIVFTLMKGKMTRRHYEDMAIVGVASLFALLYYYEVAFGRLAYLEPLTGMLPLIFVAGILSLIAIAVLAMKNHWYGTFAPIPAIGLIVVILWDYEDPLFPYKPSAPAYLFILVGAMAVCVFFAWYGFEKIIENQASKFRAIPVGLLLPALTVILFALISPAVENKLQLIYRSFDLAVPALALGAATAFGAFFSSKRKRTVALLAVLIGAILVTLPFGVYTSQLLGIRHDTQGYEVDSIGWIDGHSKSTEVQSDERISYIAMSVFGIGKDNRLPQHLLTNASLAPELYYVYEESWANQGVNDFPRGMVKPSGDFMSGLLHVEDVMYIGGEKSDQVVVFKATSIGQTYCNWYPWVQ